MTRILSFDPGVTTGYALLDVDGDAEPSLLIAGEFPLWGKYMEEFLIENKPDIVVYEEFRLYPAVAKAKSWSTFPEVEVIGVIKYLCEQRGTPLIAQRASVKARTTIPPRVAGVRGPHARDALKHALYYIERTRQ